MDSCIDTDLKVQTEYIRFENICTLSSCYIFQVHLQQSQRCSVVQTALQQCKVLPGMLSMFPGTSTLVTGFPNLVVGTAKVVAVAPRLIASTPRCSPGCYHRFSILADFLPVLPGTPECYCIGPLNFPI